MSEVIWWPVLGQNKKKQCYFWIPLTQETYILVNIMQNEWIENFGLWSEVIWWPLRGQNEKIMSFLDFLALETYISIYIIQSQWIQNYGLWSEVKSHLVTSTRSNEKIMSFFGFLSLKNLYCNIHHSKSVNSKFWPLIRGQRSFGDLYEVKMKK